MDIPDDWGKEFDIALYEETFDAAIEFAVKYPDTLWVYGNHDLCYLWNERESGYSPIAARTVCEKLGKLQRVLPEGNEMRYIQRIDDVLFCHGGVQDRFVRKTVPSSKYNDIDEVLDMINGLVGGVHVERSVADMAQASVQQCQNVQAAKAAAGSGAYARGGKFTERGNVISCDVFSTYRDGRPIGTCENIR